MTRANLMRARCKYCGGQLRYANIPNRGPVMAHGAGERQRCDRMIALGNDLITRAEQAAEQLARSESLRLQYLKDRDYRRILSKTPTQRKDQ